MHLQTIGQPVEPDLIFVFDLVANETAPPGRTNVCGQMV